MNQNLLEVRRNLKERKPEFIRQDSPKRMKVGFKWRKPKGIHSKIRHHFKGRRKMPSPGFKSPLKVRGLHASGLKIVNVSSVNEVQKIKKNTEGIIISKSVGAKKRLEILKKAKELNITILNLNVDEHIKKIEDMINSKKPKTEKEANKEIKEKSVKESKEQKEEKQEASDKTKKEAEKKERDKLLTKRL